MVNRSCCCFGSKPRASEVSDAAGNGAKVHTTNGLDLNPTAKAGAGDINGAKPKSKGPTPGPVLVELFTSQGCTTSPAADLLISKLGQGDSLRELELDVPVIFLAYHVEYWDYLGWKDPFASSLWTVRQRAYGQSLQQDSIYTPQVVVQGRSQCLGSDTESVLSLIRSAPRFTSSEIKVRIPCFCCSGILTVRCFCSFSVIFLVNNLVLCNPQKSSPLRFNTQKSNVVSNF